MERGEKWNTNQTGKLTLQAQNISLVIAIVFQYLGQHIVNRMCYMLAALIKLQP